MHILFECRHSAAGGEPFPKQIENHIGKPLKMASLQMDLPETKSNWAAGYEKNKSEEVVRGTDKGEYWKHGG